MASPLAATNSGRASIPDPATTHSYSTEEQPSACRTVHAWVLVMAGKRDVPEAIFLEPSTGRRYPLNASPYEGVEYLWNNTNFWVCMQQPQPHSDSRALPGSISWDLSDLAQWEPLFEDRNSRMHTDGGEGDLIDMRADSAIGAARANMGSQQSTAPRSMGGAGPGGQVVSGKSVAGGARSSVVSGNVSRGGPAVASRVAAARRGAGGAGGDGLPRTAESAPDSELGGVGDDALAGADDLVPDVPRSWVLKLSIPRDAFDMRCPRVSAVSGCKS